MEVSESAPPSRLLSEFTLTVVCQYLTATDRLNMRVSCAMRDLLAQVPWCTASIDSHNLSSSFDFGNMITTSPSIRILKIEHGARYLLHSDIAVAFAPTIETLWLLNFHYAGFPDFPVVNMPHLTELRVQQAPHPAGTIGPRLSLSFGAHVPLKRLCLDFVGANDLCPISKTVEVIRLVNTGVAQERVCKQVQQLPNLIEINISIDAGYSHKRVEWRFAPTNTLRRLAVSSYSNHAFTTADGLRGLTHFSAAGNCVSPLWLSLDFSRMQWLQQLRLAHARWDGELCVAPMPSVRTIALKYCRLSDCSMMKWFPNATTASFEYCGIKTLAGLEKDDSLEALCIREFNARELNVTAICECKSLEYVRFDVGAFGPREAFLLCPRLRQVVTTSSWTYANAWANASDRHYVVEGEVRLTTYTFTNKNTP